MRFQLSCRARRAGRPGPGRPGRTAAVAGVRLGLFDYAGGLHADDPGRGAGAGGAGRWRWVAEERHSTRNAGDGKRWAWRRWRGR